MKKILKHIWVAWFYFTFISTFLLLYPFFYILLSREGWYPAANKLRIMWASVFCILIGVITKKTTEEPLKKDKAYIFCPNHSSELDIPLFAATCEGYYHFMAKAELAKIPLFSIFFRTIDIPVDRSSRISSYRSLKKAGDNIDKNQNIVIFPEGTISHLAPKMLEYKNGPFLLAIHKQVAIVPVTILDNWKLFPDETFTGRPGISRIVFHKPIATKDMTEKDVNELKEKVFNTIDQKLKQHYEVR